MPQIKPNHRLAVTLMELLVVVLIIGILATIATGVYTGETQRARVAATRDLIRQLEIAITRYEVDLGLFPPSGSGTTVVPTSTRQNGSGYLHMALVHSLSGSASRPASALWKGPYINLNAVNLDATATNAASSDILDSWGNVVVYVESSFYPTRNGTTFYGGTELFNSSAPNGANPVLPDPNPFYALGETYYNPNSYQIISPGPNAVTFAPPYHGTELDDVTNFGY